MFRAEAPGKTRSELRIKRPTQEIAKVTTIAMATVNSVCVCKILKPREDAN